MGGINSRIAGACALLVVAAACKNQDKQLDLATNEELYRTPTYRATVSADRPAFLTPVVDDRAEVGVDEASGPYPMRWMAEGYWERSLPLMIDDCLRMAFEQSEVFAGLEQSSPPSAKALIVSPHLLEARGGQEERVYGRRSLGAVSLRIEIRGPAAADGSREVVFDETFPQTVGTSVGASPERIPIVIGRALQQSVASILAKIDQSNVARSGL